MEQVPGRRSSECTHSSRWPITSLRSAAHIRRVSRTRPQLGPARPGTTRLGSASVPPSLKRLPSKLGWSHGKGLHTLAERSVSAARRSAHRARLQRYVSGHVHPRVAAAAAAAAARVREGRELGAHTLLGKRCTSLCARDAPHTVGVTRGVCGT